MTRKPKLVILGTGFAGYSTLKALNRKLFEIVVISPRDHFLFTPLLTGTTVGTIEFRSIIEPIRALSGVRYLAGKAVSIDAKTKTVAYSSNFSESIYHESYDLLAICVGAKAHDFGVPGVKEHAHFLKELSDARALRYHLLECLERASAVDLTDQERADLLSVVVVGGGPTGVECAAELHDFMNHDLRRLYPELIGLASITVYEASQKLLGSFDENLSEYAREVFRRHHIAVKLGAMVTEITEDSVVLNSGEQVPAGLVVWSAGTSAHSFTEGLPFTKSNRGLLKVDEFLRVQGYEDIYALGDCAFFGEGLPATAQIAQQQGKYLARLLTCWTLGKEMSPYIPSSLGMLAYLGDNLALADLPFAKFRGFFAWLFWRSAYLTKLVSIKNKFLVLSNWIRTQLFGRDVSRF